MTENIKDDKKTEVSFVKVQRLFICADTFNVGVSVVIIFSWGFR